MATPIDDLKPGDFIAITGIKKVSYDWTGSPVEHSFHGIPAKVIEISLPFIAVEQRDKIGSIDVRLHEVQRVTQRYADFMLSGKKSLKLTRTEKRKRTQEAKKIAEEQGLCPRCGDKMIQKFLTDKQWHRFCRRCGFDGGLAIIPSGE